MKKRRKNLPAGRQGKIDFGDIQEKAMNWLWVGLLIAAIMFLRGLLSDMNTQTNRLSEERKRFQEDLSEERKKSQNLYQEFYAELNESVKKAIEAFNNK